MLLGMFKTIRKIFKSNSIPDNQLIKKKTPLQTNLQENIRIIMEVVGNSPDVVTGNLASERKSRLKQLWSLQKACLMLNLSINLSWNL